MTQRTDPYDPELRDHRPRPRPRPGHREGNGGILDQHHPPLIGKVIDITPARATGTEPTLNGTSIFTQDVPLLQTNASDLRDPETLVIAIDANPSVLSLPVTSNVVMAQAVLDFGSGTAQFGQNQQGLAGLPTQIVVDVSVGTQILVPASFVRLSFRYVALKTAAFAANDIVGPAYHVNVSLNYGTKNTVGLVTKTEPFATIANGASANFAKAKFATAVEVTWQPYTVAGGPVTCSFNAAFGGGATLWNPQIVGNTVPPPRLPWPVGAELLNVANGSAAPINFVTVKQYLSF